MSDAGLPVDIGICDLPTAFSSRIGNGPLHIAICAEYDALPVIGHACGHNIIAASAVGAALALAPLVDELGITLSVIGTPAEEGGGGKILMLERGAFDGVHAALMVHPTPKEDLYPRVSAVAHMRVQYTGRESHAAIAPELGINAADAFTVAQVAIGLLRQHLRPFDQVHGIITHGGDATNVDPGPHRRNLDGTLSHPRRSRAARAARRSLLRGRRTRNRREPRASPTCAPRTPTWSTITISPSCSAPMRPPSDARSPKTACRRSRPTWATCRSRCRRSIPASRSRPAARSTINPSSREAAINASADRAVSEGALAMAWTVIDAATGPLRDRLLQTR